MGPAQGGSMKTLHEAAPAQPVPQPTPRTADCLMCGHCAATGERVAAPVVPDALVEAIAKAIYYEWRRDAGYVPWVDGGNSDKQNDARKIARAVVSGAAPVVPLTDEQLAKIAVEDEFLLYCDQDSFNEIARAIERAHGIGK